MIEWPRRLTTRISKKRLADERVPSFAIEPDGCLQDATATNDAKTRTLLRISERLKAKRVRIANKNASVEFKHANITAILTLH